MNLMTAPNVCVLNVAGVNCNEETGIAFEQAGANVEQVHISQLHGGDKRLADFQILAFSGGFSYGDAIRAGAILGQEIERTPLADQVNRFVENDGLVIGICNGFQVLTSMGLLPSGRIEPGGDKPLSLVRNERGKFVDNWQHLRTEKGNKCLFAQPEDIGDLIELPVANGEGRLVAKDTVAMADRLALDGLVVFRYATPSGEVTEAFPDNPSGSLFGITGVCDPSGKVLGLMPHPERFIYTTQHPNWRRGDGKTPYGKLIIHQMVKVAKAA